jgi:putative flippase GtrA
MPEQLEQNMTKKTKRPIIFLAVGILNTLLDFAFYTFLTTTILSGAEDIALAGIVSGTFALVCAFITHGYITFRGSNLGKKTLLKFVAFTGFGMWVIRPLLLALFIKWDALYKWAHDLSQTIGLPFSYDFIANTGSFGFMVIIVLLYNYYVYGRYVFNENRAASS